MSEKYQQGIVSKTIWPWQDSARNKKRTPPTLIYSFIVLLTGLVASAGFWYFDHKHMSLFVLGIAVFVFLCSRLFPALYRVLEKVLSAFSHFIGFCITWLLLVPFFYLFFTMGRCFQKISRHDPMTREIDVEVKTYWLQREKQTGLQQYKRQF